MMVQSNGSDALVPCNVVSTIHTVISKDTLLSEN